MTTKLLGFKGFNKELKCNDYQFEIGKTHVHEGLVKLCNSGFHFCENALDVLKYYGAGESRFAEVETEDAADQKDGDSKRVCKTLTVKAELTLHALIGAGVKFILEKVDWANAKESNTGSRSAATNTGDGSAATNTGYGSAATNTGYGSAATNTGYGSAATNTGDGSAATNTGREGCAISIGINGKARGAVGCWLTLAEWKEDPKTYEWHRIDVQTKKVDGKKIKANTFYVLKKGKFVVVPE